MVISPYLNKGDKIRIVAPAGKIQKELVLQGVEWLKTIGFKVETGTHVTDERNQFAGSDENRLADMQEALDDRDAKAIICARGGYGSIRLINKLNFTKFKKHPKWLVGFSDITVFHSVFNKLRIASIHGPMLRHFPNPGEEGSESVQHLFQLLKAGHTKAYKTIAGKYNREGNAKAELVGGNLSILYSLMGTHFDLNVKGKILFIEDIGEYLYHTDRMVHSLKMSGKLGGLKGLVVGDFTSMKDNKASFGMNVHEIIADAVNEYNYPVCFGFPAGHNKINLPLVFGRGWELDVTGQSSVLKLT